MPGAEHGPSPEDPQQHQGLRERDMSRQRAAVIGNATMSNGHESSRHGGRDGHTSS